MLATIRLNFDLDTSSQVALHNWISAMKSVVGLEGTALVDVAKVVERLALIEIRGCAIGIVNTSDISLWEFYV